MATAHLQNQTIHLAHHRIIVSSIIALHILVFSIFTVPTISIADSLSIIEAQIKKDEQRFGRSDKSELYGARWLVPGSNFTKIFIYRDGPALLTEWMGLSIPGYRAAQPKTRRTSEFVSSKIAFLPARGPAIQVAIYVPHPKYASMIELDLIKEIKDLVPNNDLVLGSKDIKLSGNTTAKMYILAGEHCVVVANLVKEARIQVSSSKCKHADTISDFAKLLDLERLNSKLNS